MGGLFGSPSAPTAPAPVAPPPAAAPASLANTGVAQAAANQRTKAMQAAAGASIAANPDMGAAPATSKSNLLGAS